MQRLPIYCVRSLRHASRFSTLVEKTRPKIQEISPQQAFAQKQQLIFVDVREQNEWEQLVSGRRTHLELKILRPSNPGRGRRGPPAVF